jgi:hypothetical protein
MFNSFTQKCNCSNFAPLFYFNFFFNFTESQDLILKKKIPPLPVFPLGGGLFAAPVSPFRRRGDVYVVAVDGTPPLGHFVVDNSSYPLTPYPQVKIITPPPGDVGGEVEFAAEVEGAWFCNGTCENGGGGLFNVTVHVDGGAAANLTPLPLNSLRHTLRLEDGPHHIFVTIQNVSDGLILMGSSVVNVNVKSSPSPPPPPTPPEPPVVRGFYHVGTLGDWAPIVAEQLPKIAAMREAVDVVATGGGRFLVRDMLADFDGFEVGGGGLGRC